MGYTTYKRWEVEKAMWILFACLSAFFAGCTAILAKIGIEDTDSHLVTALRTVVVLIFTWLMVFLVGSQDTIGTITPYSYLYLFLSGLSTGASWLCYFRALQLGDVSKVTPIDKSSTVLTMVLALIFLGESVTFFKLLGMLGIALGTYWMIQRKPARQATVPTSAAKSKGWLFYGFLSAIFAALTSILGKIGIENVESNLGTALRTIVVLLMAWAIVFATGKQKEISHIRPKSWWFIILSGIATGLSWLCYYKALQTGPASIVAPIDKLSVLVTVLFAAVFLKEKLSRRALLGLIVLTAGTLLLLVPSSFPF